MKGSVTEAPKGATVIREVLVGATWTKRGAAASIKADGTWTMNAVAPERAQTMKFRYSVVSNGKKVVVSSTRAVTFRK